MLTCAKCSCLLRGSINKDRIDHWICGKMEFFGEFDNWFQKGGKNKILIGMDFKRMKNEKRVNTENSFKKRVFFVFF